MLMPFYKHITATPLKECQHSASLDTPIALNFNKRSQRNAPPKSVRFYKTKTSTI